MGLVTNKWTIAFRKKRGKLLDDLSGFIPIKADSKGCYADPFLFDYQGETYLFAEYYNYRHGLGTIAYARYDRLNNRFGDFREIIKEDYHMSYPLVFVYKNEIYMMPEANDSNTMYLYKAKQFPDSWTKYAVLSEDARYVDTSLFEYNEKLFLITKENQSLQAPMRLLKIDSEAWKVLDSKIVTNDVSLSRPGGNVFKMDEEFYIPTQDCKDDYGAALNFLRFSVDSEMNLNYELVKKITPDKLRIEGIEGINGIHTYNFSNELEVIDFKFPVKSFNRLFWKLIRVSKQKLNLSK